MGSGVAAVIAAAGAGTRLGLVSSDDPKALRQLASRSLLEWSVGAVAPLVDCIVVAAPAAALDAVQAITASLPGDVATVAGGATRQESVARALTAVADDTEFVLVHDAARPLVPEAVVSRVLGKLRAGAVAVVPAVPSPDSLRHVAEDGVSVALDRSRVRAVQTPQGFRLDVLRRAHSAAADDRDASDDAVLVERTGVNVALVDGSQLAFKITTALDLMLAEAVVSARGAIAQR